MKPVAAIKRATELGTAFADEFIERHFQAWLERHIHEDDRDMVADKIRRLLADDPDLLLGDRGWPELREMAGA